MPPSPRERGEAASPSAGGSSAHASDVEDALAGAEGSHPQWTPQERLAYVASLGSAGLPEAAAVQVFLCDVLAGATLPPRWIPGRDKKGRLFYANMATRKSSWKHPLELQLQELSEVCIECLSLSEVDAGSRLYELDAAWRKDAEVAVSKWREVAQEGGRSYFYHKDTHERRWDNPLDSLYPSYRIKLEGLRKLNDAAYLSHLRQEVESANAPAAELGVSAASPADSSAGSRAGSPAKRGRPASPRAAAQADGRSSEARRRTLGERPKVPAGAWMRPTDYARELGLNVETDQLDQIIFDTLAPILSSELPIPWVLEQERGQFVHPGYEPPLATSLHEHPLQQLHLEIVKALRQAIYTQKARGSVDTQRALTRVVQSVASGGCLRDFGRWTQLRPAELGETGGSSGCAFEDCASGLRRRDDPQLAAASHVGLSLALLKVVWEGVVTANTGGAFPLTEDEIWQRAERAADAVVCAQRSKRSASPPPSPQRRAELAASRGAGERAADAAGLLTREQWEAELRSVTARMQDVLARQQEEALRAQREQFQQELSASLTAQRQEMAQLRRQLEGGQAEAQEEKIRAEVQSAVAAQQAELLEVRRQAAQTRNRLEEELRRALEESGRQSEEQARCRAEFEEQRVQLKAEMRSTVEGQQAELNVVMMQLQEQERAGRPREAFAVELPQLLELRRPMPPDRRPAPPEPPAPPAPVRPRSAGAPQAPPRSRQADEATLLPSEMPFAPPSSDGAVGDDKAMSAGTSCAVTREDAGTSGAAACGDAEVPSAAAASSCPVLEDRRPSPEELRMEQHVSSEAERRLLMVGLDAAGKTTLLYRLKLGDIVPAAPTVGLNVETVEYKDLSLTFRDVGGCDKMRPLWRHYAEGAEALVCVVDSSDRDRIELATEELRQLLAGNELEGVPLLVYANKQDLPLAMSVKEVTDRMALHDLRRRNWYVKAACATTGDGLHEGLDWLCGQVRGRREQAGGSGGAGGCGLAAQQPCARMEAGQGREEQRREELLAERPEREGNDDQEAEEGEEELEGGRAGTGETSQSWRAEAERRLVEEVRNSLLLQEEAVLEANARTELAVRAQLEEALAASGGAGLEMAAEAGAAAAAALAAAQGATEALQRREGGDLLIRHAIEEEVHHALAEQQAELLEANRYMTSELQSQLKESIAPLAQHVKEVERRISQDVARAQAGEEEARRRLAEELDRVQKAEALASAMQQKTAEAVEKQAAETRELLKSQASEAEIARDESIRAREAEQAREAAHQKTLAEMRQTEALKEQAAQRKLREAEEEGRRAREGRRAAEEALERERRESQLAAERVEELEWQRRVTQDAIERQRQGDLKRRQEEAEKQEALQAEKRKMEWEAERRELELKAEMRQLQWEADWKAAQKLEKSVLASLAGPGADSGSTDSSTARLEACQPPADAPGARAWSAGSSRGSGGSRGHGQRPPPILVEFDGERMPKGLAAARAGDGDASAGARLRPEESKAAGPRQQRITRPAAEAHERLGSRQGVASHQRLGSRQSAASPPKLRLTSKQSLANRSDTVYEDELAALQAMGAARPTLAPSPTPRRPASALQRKRRGSSAKGGRRPLSAGATQFQSHREIAEAVANDLWEPSIEKPLEGIAHSSSAPAVGPSTSCRRQHGSSPSNTRARQRLAAGGVSYKNVAVHSAKWFNLHCARARDTEISYAAACARARASETARRGLVPHATFQEEVSDDFAGTGSPSLGSPSSRESGDASGRHR